MDSETIMQMRNPNTLTLYQSDDDKDDDEIYDFEQETVKVKLYIKGTCVRSKIEEYRRTSNHIPEIHKQEYASVIIFFWCIYLPVTLF